MTGYKLCTWSGHRGPRWLPVVYFRPRGWLPSKLAPLYLSSDCEACHRIRVREAFRRMMTDGRLSKRRVRRRETDRLAHWEARRRAGRPERSD